MDKVNILLVDDQPAKLLSYEVMLRGLGENLLTANSAREAFDHLLRTEVAVVLVDVFMPDLNGFELARMVREHPRFQQTSVIFISAVLQSDLDFLQGYELGAVDYVPVPVVPEILRAKVKVFAELYRKTRQLESLNRELEQRVSQRTAELEASAAQLRKSEERLRLALDAAQMGWWDYDFGADRVTWSPSLARLVGISPETIGGTFDELLAHVHSDDRVRFRALVENGAAADPDNPPEVRFLRSDGTVRWSLVAGQVIRDPEGRAAHFAGVDLDITGRKQAEERQLTLVREIDHRSKNLLAIVQSVLHLSRADTMPEFVASVEGRIRALARAHTLLSETRWQSVDLGRIVSEEIAPFATGQAKRIAAAGPAVSLQPGTAQSLSLALHELATNAAKYGALSAVQGRVSLGWELEREALVLRWSETGGPTIRPPTRTGFGTKVISASIERQLGGRSTFDWRPEGLHCTLEIPRANVNTLQVVNGASHRLDRPEAVPSSAAVAGRTCLVVEDEAVVAMNLKQWLGELGFDVVGPISALPQALAAATDASIHCAVLDVNIGGLPIYLVADALAARGVPFVFVTGYSRNSIDPQYAHVPTLEKPIDLLMLRKAFVNHSTAWAAGPEREEGRAATA
jgi:PAS domain S-box-containing protein